MSMPILIAGSIGSPYTRKMRALMRYRRIEFRTLDWQLSFAGHSVGADDRHQQRLPKPPLPLMPAIYFPSRDGYVGTSDSTFQIRRLESEFSGRSVIPADPAVAWIDHLIEDYADEWCTKMMFHYRWAVDADHANRILPRWMLGVPESFADAFAENFGQRQIDRLALVGSTRATAPIIEASYQRLLHALEAHLQQHRFIMGDRPGTADFGLVGQLTQLVQVEPTAAALARRIAPRVTPWVDILEDLSGFEVEDDGFVSANSIPKSLGALLMEIGATYVPFLLANAGALASGAETCSCEIGGQRYTQAPFRYQGKCLTWLREAYEALPEASRTAVDDIIAGTGVERLVVG